jgi:hypothetical protein
MIYGGIIQRERSEEKANYKDTVQKSEENLPKLKILTSIETAGEPWNLISQLQLRISSKISRQFATSTVGRRFSRYDGAKFGGLFMGDQTVENSSARVTSPRSREVRHEDRNVWVLTAYGVSALALFGILAYYFSDFITR